MIPRKRSPSPLPGMPPDKKAAASSEGSQVPVFWDDRYVLLAHARAEFQGRVVCRSSAILSCERATEILVHSAARIVRNIDTSVPPDRRGTFGKIIEASPAPRTGEQSFVIKFNISEEQYSAFENEALVHTNLDHRNIVPCLGYCTLPYTMQTLLLMPRISSTLSFKLENTAALPCATCLTMAEQIADGLSYLHRKNLVHGDIAYRNILLGQSNHVFICDFGRVANHGATNPNSPAKGKASQRKRGSHCSNRDLQPGDLSLAPELFYCAQMTTSSDIYGWGAIALNLLRCDKRWVTWSNAPHCDFDFHCSPYCQHLCSKGTYKPESLRSVTSHRDALTLNLCDINDKNYHQVNKLRALAEQSLSINPSDRPSGIHDVYAQLQRLRINSPDAQTASPSLHTAPGVPAP